MFYNGVQGTQIGGIGTGEGNIISGNTSSGVIIDGNGLSSTTNNIIQANIIGLNAAGTATLGNGDSGIRIFNALGANMIGGTTAAARNVISGNDDGIYVQQADGITIQGNYIGTDVTGLIDLGNNDRGIQLESGANNTIIGGTTASARNVISGNNNDGIIISDGGNPGIGTTGTVIQGNYIGVGSDGTTAVGNGTHGVRVTTESGNLIGGTAVGAGNVIAHNGGDGVHLQNSTADDNPILGNSIYANNGEGIDLGGNGVTANDSNDGDSGANGLQNFPVLSQADLSGANLTLSGTLDTDGPNTQYRIEFFGNTSGTQDATHGEGRFYLGSTTVTSNGSGDAAFSGVVLSGVTLAAGDFVTATATKIDDPGQVGVDDQLAYGPTSEFAANVSIQPGNSDPIVTFGGGNVVYVENDPAIFIDAIATVTDPDLSDFDGGVLTISITSNASGDDRIRINNEGMGAGQIGMTTGPNEVYYGGALIGSWSGNGVPLSITFNATADATAVEAVLQNIMFENVSDQPSTLTRTVQFQLTDGDGGTSTAITKDIDITATNDAPTFATANSTPTFNENGGAVSLFSGTSVDAIETGDLIDTVVLTVDAIANGNNEMLVIDGQNIELTHLNNETTTTGGYDVSVAVAGNTATVTITKIGGFTAAAAEALVDGLAYNNTSDDPQGAVRLITLTSIKDDGGTANGGSDTSGIGIASLVTITPANDAPTITDGFAEGLPGTDEDSVSAGTSVTSIVNNAGWNDPDAGALRGMAITSITGSGSWQYSTDAVTWTSFGSVSATSALLLDASTQVRFVGDGINGEVASFNFRAWDMTTDAASTNAAPSYADPGAGGGTAAYSTESATANITVTSVNDEQMLSTNAGATVFEGSTGNVITTAMLEATDVDNPPGQLTYTLSSIPTNGLLRRSGVNLLVSSTFTQADIDAGIITYLHDDSETTSDSFSFTVDDGAGITSSGTFNISVTPVNDNSTTAISDTDATTNVTLENASIGTTLGVTAFADDADAGDNVTYSLDDNDGGRFTIDANTGVVTVAGTIDRETDGASRSITVRATSTDTTFTTRMFSININDVDEFDVGAVTDSDLTANAVDENAANGTVVGVTALAADADATNNAITYTLDDNAGGRFTIDGSTGVVTVADGTLLDREAAASHDITVRATRATAVSTPR